MKLKKVLSIFLSVSMMLSIMPNVFAAGDDRLVDGTSKAKISCELFKYKEGFNDDNAEFQTGSTTPLVEKMTALEDTTKDSEFFVGIKLSGITNIKAAVGDEGGLNSMFVKLNFNSEYIKPADTYLSDSYSRFAYLIGAKNTSAIFANKATTKYLLNDDASDITPNSVNISIKPKSIRYNGSDDQYIGMIKFKLAKDAPTVNVPNVLSFDDNDYNISFGEYGNAGSFEPSDDDDYLDIRTLFDLDTSAINIYANIAGASLESIKVKNAPYTIPNQFVGSALNTTGLQLTGHYGDNSDKDLTATDMANVKFYYGATGATSTTGLTAVPASQKEIKDIDNKVLYAEYKGKIVEIGKYVVKPVTITEITVNNNTIPTNIYDDTNINFNNLTVNVKKNNNDTATDLPFTNYENVSNGLAIYKSNADGDVLAQVTDSDKYTHGDNYFVVAVKSDATVKSTVFTVTSNYDDITISASTNNAAKTSYNKDDNFDPTGIVVKAKKASETTGADVAFDNFDSNYKVVIATSETEAKTATAVTASTKITEAMLDGNHNVYVVYTNAGSNTQSVVSVATLGAKKIKSATISGGKTAYTYGDKLKTDDLELNVKYDDNSTGKISYADLAAAGITVKIGETLVDANTVITPAMKGKTVDFIYDGKTLTSSAKITVAAKTVYYTVSDATITKVYDGGLTIPADQTLPTISIKDSATAFVGTDSYTVTGTFAYTDKNVGTDKKIKLTTTLPETNGKYTFAPDTDKINADGTLKTAATITAKALTLNAGVITGFSTKADPNATADVTKDGSLVLTTANSNLVDGDNVTVPYTYTFAKDDVKTAGNDKNVTITLKDLTGADKDNYTFDKTQVTTAKGNVTQDAMSDIEISGPTKVTYTYPELTPDFGGLVVNAVYGTGTSATKAPVTNYKLLDKDGNEFDKTAKLPYGDTTITVSYTEGSVTKTKTITLTAKKKPIKLSDIIFKPESKSYDGTTTATGTATVKDGVTVAGDTVNISAKWEFDGKDVGTNTIKVSDIKADNENYEIVGEDNLPVSSTTINNSTAVIKPATPENVTAKADKKTNNIVLSGTTADFEYSTDNGATWVKAAAGTTTIENAVRNKEYTILVRTAATTSAPASDAATVKATTYKYLVNIYKNGAAAGSEPEYKVYTNDEEINAVKDDTTFGKFNSNVLQYTPSRFRAYFTDSACTTSADVANLPKDSNDNINLYYTAKKSSGGGGSSVSIKLDKDTVSGVVGDKIKVTATVTGSTAKPTWTSSNEDVATVDENGNITFVGKGTATVKVKVNGIVKNIPVTVKEATATPVPTVKPTEAPVINTEYTKPYASGYDDGSFLPNNNITRGELAAMIARLSYGDDLPDGMYQASFPDVDSDAWFNKYIGYLEDKDVLSGYEDGTFRPMDTITRGEISAVIARAQRYDLISYNGIFTDVTENDWAKDYIETLADKNIVSGYEDGTFGPYSPLTRAEAVAIINRVLVESTPIVTFTPNDIAGHWAEADILLAVNERMVGANAVVPTVKPEETAAPEETVAPEKTTAPEATPAA